MFERYTETARRSLFFSRYEASQLGSITIDSEHLMLGLIREPAILKGLLSVQLDQLRRGIAAGGPSKKKCPVCRILQRRGQACLELRRRRPMP